MGLEASKDMSGEWWGGRGGRPVKDMSGEGWGGRPVKTCQVRGGVGGQ